jgi:hypothetical protein
MSGIIAQNLLDGSGLVKAPEGGGAWNFISKQTASSDSTISFTSGIDSTYREYLFTFNNIHPATDGAEFKFNLSVDTGSNYNVTKTTTHIYAFHTEADDAASLSYDTSRDLAQGTGFQNLTGDTGNNNDQSLSGSLQIFNPSSTTFVKNFLANTNSYYSSDSSYNSYVSGYGNTTSAVDAIQFKMSTGNIDAGDICLYGLTT